jgi:catechol 2,3-dioxygenase-like lactoylglutathione lyase family enzyme
MMRWRRCALQYNERNILIIAPSVSIVDVQYHLSHPSNRAKVLGATRTMIYMVLRDHTPTLSLNLQHRNMIRAVAFLGSILLQHKCHAFLHHWPAFSGMSSSQSPTFMILRQSGAKGENHFSKNLPNSSEDDDDESENLLSDPSAASRLSHAMLQVPSVDTTVSYWKEIAYAKVTASSKLDETSKNENANDELRSAFVVLGNGKTTENCFALELVRHQDKLFELGNAISYLGVSKLLQYANTEDLLQVLTGNDKKLPAKKEPNGIEVSSCASAPGDFFARFCLHAVDMEATADFYTNILGMKIAAVDDDGKTLCLRYVSPMRSSGNEKKEYQSGPSYYGVPTTLVFEPLPTSSASLETGSCFDHLVIQTQADIDAVHEQLQTLLEGKNGLNCSVFMKPTEMFGQKVLGVLDPNGYKVILAGNTA